MLALVSLITNIVTVARQGVEKWWDSIVSDGKLQVIWMDGSRPPGVTVRAKAEGGSGVEFDPDSAVSVPAGRYGIKVMQLDKQLPVAIQSADGRDVTFVEVSRFRTALARVRPNPTDPLFEDAYGLLADSLGRPKSKSRRLQRVFQGFHQNGTMLWFFDTNTFYILRASDGTWTEVPDAPYPLDPCIYDQDCVDSRAHAPKGLHVPFGGGYRVWNQFGGDLGWMIGYCIYSDSVTREDFEQGFVVGPLRASSIGDYYSIGFAISADKDRRMWRAPTLFGVRPAQCNDR